MNATIHPMRHQPRAKALTQADISRRIKEMTEEHDKRMAELRQLREQMARTPDEPVRSTLDTQLDTISRLLEERPVLTVKNVSAELHVSVKTAYRRLVELARRKRAHVWFDAHPEHPNTARLLAVRNERAVVDVD
jgi:hypothetical protein